MAQILPGQERIRISKLCKGGSPTTKFFEDIPTQSLYGLFMRGCRMAEGGNGACLGTRVSPSGPYEWKTYNEVRALAQRVGSGLLALGYTSHQQDKVGIFAANRWEWDVTQLACNAYSLLTVPLYDTMGANAISHILEKTEMRTIVCQDSSKALKLLEASNANSQCHVTTIVTMEPADEDTQKRLQDARMRYMSFEGLAKLGAECCVQPNPPSETELALLIFTSGTTGTPKGAMLSHLNLVCDVGAVALHCKSVCEPTNEDAMLSYLPQAHGFNQVATQLMLSHGGRVGYLSGGNILNLMGDLQALKPTILPIVPRLLNRIYDNVWAKVSKSCVKKLLLKKAYEAKKQRMLTSHHRLPRDIWDVVVFKKVHKMLGGRLKAIVTGSAPVSAEVLTFIRSAVGCQVLEGYGQTETTAAATCTNPGDYSPGHVGVPLPCCEIKLVDIPDMNYYASKDQGEVCIRGANCFAGYWRDEKNTLETLDSQGWVHSGDVGAWTDQGTLRLVDRKKHIFKLAQGEYIAPEKIEGIYLQSPLVSQVFLHGDSLETCCVAVVVPDEPGLRLAASRAGIATGSGHSEEPVSLEVLCSERAVRKLVLDSMQTQGAKHGLNSLEQAKSVFLWSGQFSVENDLLTPTLKSKRPQLRAKFSRNILDMYQALRG